MRLRTRACDRDALRGGGWAARHDVHYSQRVLFAPVASAGSRRVKTKGCESSFRSACAEWMFSRIEGFQLALEERPTRLSMKRCKRQPECCETGTDSVLRKDSPNENAVRGSGVASGGVQIHTTRLHRVAPDAQHPLNKLMRDGSSRWWMPRGNTPCARRTHLVKILDSRVEVTPPSRYEGIRISTTAVFVYQVTTVPPPRVTEGA
ncbi:hypothetical protein FGB62_175g03 [Gracilaria domingensis]|nr:hypothetical protein FGB62_175g03 [Gracilaria domingensis]